MNANELADYLDNNVEAMIMSEQTHIDQAATMLRQQQAEIEDLKSANRFIQNFAEEQHQRAVALEMRELTDEEIDNVGDEVSNLIDTYAGRREFAKAILRKAQEKTTQSVMSEHCTCYKLGYSQLNDYRKVKAK